MIVEDKPRWLHLVFRWRGSVLPRIWARIAVTASLALVVTVLDHFVWVGQLELLTLVPFSLIALALSIFLGFRNNTSYDRFWEGRKLWGRFVNTSRSLSRQLLTLVRAPEPEQEEEVRVLQRELVLSLAGYIHAVRLHLRDQAWSGEVEGLLTPEALGRAQGVLNKPVMILQVLGEQLQEAAHRGWIDPFHVPLLEGSLTELTDIQGGCERIKSTPIPFSYTVLIHRIVAIYCLALPFGIVKEAGLATPLVVLMVSYAFFGLDAIGDEIEDPFGEDINDLPLSAISRMIEINLRQSLEDMETPPPMRPSGGVLR